MEDWPPNSKGGEIKAQVSTKVEKKKLFHAIETPSIREEHEKTNQQLMNWEGRVTHSQGDGVAHSIWVNSKHYLPSTTQIPALLCNATSYQALHFSPLLFLPSFVRLPYLHCS